MSMTKKDFEAIAKVIVENKSFADYPQDDIVFKKELVSELADYFKQANPRFDRKKFFEACDCIR